MTAYEMLKKLQAEGIAPLPTEQAASPVVAPSPVAPVAPVVAPTPVAPTPVVAKPAKVKQTAKQVAQKVQVAAGLKGNPGDILSRAMLVAFSCPIPTNDKTDKETTQKVKVSQNMGQNSGKWQKTIYPPATYKAMSCVFGAARTWHYSQTLSCWPVSGLQVLPLANHNSYTTGMREWKQKCNEARDKFLAALPSMAEWAKVEHNGSYDESLYDCVRVASRFGWGIQFCPIPASDHFVGSMRNVLGVDADSIDDMVTQSMADAESEMWDRLSKPLANIGHILRKLESGDHTRVTESLLENVKDIAELIPALNVNDNPVLQAFADEISTVFGSVTKDSLKDDKAVRAEVLSKADDILKRITGSR